MGSAHADARVHHGVEYVGQQIAQDGEGGADQQVGHDDGPVVSADGIKEQLAHTGVGENRFGDDRPADSPQLG